MVLVLAAIMLLSLPLAAGAATANGITSPKDGATVSGKVDVMGYASDPSFQKWQLDLLPGGDHALRLRVVRSDSNYDEYVTKSSIANR